MGKEQIVRVNIKPLSVNQAWQGRRYKSKKCHKYWHDLLLLLPRFYKLPEPPYLLNISFGLSSPLADGDNCLKTTQDIIAQKYKFNDRLIRKWVVESFSVKEGEEFIEFEILHHE